MKIVMLGVEAGLLDCLRSFSDTNSYPVKEIPDDVEGDILLWRSNEEEWAGIKEKLPELRKRFTKIGVINTRSFTTLHLGGPPFVYYFKEMAKEFDFILTYEYPDGLLFSKWMGFEHRYYLPSMVMKKVFEAFVKAWEPRILDTIGEDKSYIPQKPRVGFGIYGASPIRHFQYTAVYGDYLIDGLDVDRVVFASHPKFEEKTIAWCGKNVILYEHLPQDIFFEELQKICFCVYALTGRFSIQAQALGVPVFGGRFIDPYKDDDIHPSYRLSRIYITSNLARIHAKQLIVNPAYRMEQRKIVHNYALKHFHPDVHVEYMKRILEEILILQ